MLEKETDSTTVLCYLDVYELLFIPVSSFKTSSRVDNDKRFFVLSYCVYDLELAVNRYLLSCLRESIRLLPLLCHTILITGLHSTNISAQ